MFCCLSAVFSFSFLHPTARSIRAIKVVIMVSFAVFIVFDFDVCFVVTFVLSLEMLQNYSKPYPWFWCVLVFLVGVPLSAVSVSFLVASV